MEKARKDLNTAAQNARPYNLRKTFFYAFRQVLPIIFSYLVVGFAFGIMMQEGGYHWGHALIASIFIYSGSLQIALVPMIVAHTALPVIAVAAFLINSRYMFYGIGFTERFKKQGKLLYPYLIFAFPDEVYCVFCGTNYPKDVDSVKCDLWSAVLCHLSWVLGSVIGAAFGDLIPLDLSGIDFAATCLFVCIFVNQWLEFKSHLPMYIGAVSGLLCLFLLGPDNFMLPALSLSLVLLVIFRRRIEAKTAGVFHAADDAFPAHSASPAVSVPEVKAEQSPTPADAFAEAAEQSDRSESGKEVRHE